MVSPGESFQSLEKNIREKFPGHAFTIIAVSKTKPYKLVRQAYLEGIRNFGENYIPEAIEKFARLREEFPDAIDSVALHHIGPVQTGTLRKLFGVFQFTHGVGSLSGLNELFKRADKEKKLIRYFVQCNLSLESSKHGFSIEEIKNLKEKISASENEYCRFEGFMGIGPSDGNEVGTKLGFKNLKSLRDEFFPTKKLSMGMSGDWKWAMSFDADYLRIGSLIFGERVYGTS